MNDATTKQEATARTIRQRKQKRKARRIRMAAFYTIISIIIVLFFAISSAIASKIVTVVAEKTGFNQNIRSRFISDVAPSEEDAAAANQEEIYAPTTSATILAVGDNLIHNTVYMAAELDDGSYDFHDMYTGIAADIAGADIACINQETIYINDPEQYSNYPAFGGPTAIGDALADTGFDVVTHATNHAYDKLEQGIYDTVDFWRTKHPEVTYLGIHDSQEDADTIRVVEANNIQIAMLNYTYGVNYTYPSEPYFIDFLDDRKRIAEEIAEAKALSDCVIVFAHWGTENTFEPDDDQLSWAQFFADQGVTAVIGGHTHSLQPADAVTGKGGNVMPIFYSLGNLISHQSNNWQMLGGMAQLTITKDVSGTYVSDYSLTPTMTYMFDNGSKTDFRAMKLSDYTETEAENHLIPNTDVDTMWELYNEIVDNA